MRNIDTAILDKLAADEFKAAFLLKIFFNEGVVGFTTWDYSITYGGFDYQPRGMTIGTQKFGTASVADSVNIKIDDTDRSIYSLLLNGSYRFPASTLSVAVISDTGWVIAAVDTFVGDISEWSYLPGEIDYKISSKFVQWAKVTTSTFSGSCRWRVFKGPECKYSSLSASCNRTYDQCVAYGNTNNFGGFRWVQGVEAKTKTVRTFSGINVMSGRQ